MEKFNPQPQQPKTKEKTIKIHEGDGVTSVGPKVWGTPVDEYNKNLKADVLLTKEDYDDYPVDIDPISLEDEFAHEAKETTPHSRRKTDDPISSMAFQKVTASEKSIEKEKNKERRFDTSFDAHDSFNHPRLKKEETKKGMPTSLQERASKLLRNLFHFGQKDTYQSLEEKNEEILNDLEFEQEKKESINLDMAEEFEIKDQQQEHDKAA